MPTMTENGISTATALGTEHYSIFKTRIGLRTLVRMQYDYRHTDGTLFSCVCETLNECRDKRDAWLEKKKNN